MSDEAIKIHWNCPDCKQEGMVEVSSQINGWGMVQAVACDHARKSPGCGHEFE